MSRSIVRWLASVSVVLTMSAFHSSASSTSLSGPLTLADEGSFFVNGQAVVSGYPGSSPATGATPPGRITVKQMYVHFRVPAERKGPAIVMVHGSNHTGMTYETTPDGREGWATWFVRQGHPVYVVDHSGRGRSGFNPTPVNAVRDGGADPKSMPSLSLGTVERSWSNYRLGPIYPTTYPNLQFPIEALDQYLAQLVPNAETTLDGGGANTVDALAALLDRIGPAIVMVHSQSGLYGLDVVRKRSSLVRALVSIEGGCESMTAADAKTYFAKVPFLSVFGDNSVGLKVLNGDGRRNGCIAAVKLVQEAGGRGSFLLLPEAGQQGNSHMMMMDKNNLAIAAMLQKWIEENTAK